MTEPHRIVVGIDFGTTYTAVAWAESSRPDQVEIVKNWPTSGQLVGSQVPSEIAYPEEGTTIFSWGYDISPRAKKIKWFKLGLESSQDILTLPAGMTISNVVQDFLSALYKHIQTTLYRRFDAGVMQKTQMEFILTVPAIWSDSTKKKTEDAAVRAGFGNEHRLELLSEPESAAIYTLKNMGNANSQIRTGDRIVCCDAGGGTVDLISYEVKSILPQLSVAECTVGTGDFCGSTFIDQEFEKLFSARMGAHFNRLSAVHRQQVVKNFELCKIAFRDNPQTRTFYVNIPTISDLEDAGVYGGMFEITCQEMKQLFEPIVDQVIELISAQVVAVSIGTHRVNSILLVGGFGESEYLYQRIQAWADQYQIQVIQPREASTAIVRGAVLKGLESRSGALKTQVVRRARRSYGVPTDKVFIPGQHSELDLFIHPHTSERLAKNQISWFIRQNQAMPDDQVFRYAFRRDFKKLTTWTDTLVSSTRPVPPQRWDDGVLKHCTITSDLTSLNAKKSFDRRWHKWRRYYTANYDLVMGVRNNNLTIHLEYRGKKYGTAKVEFDEI